MVASNGNVLVTGSFEEAVNFGGETLTSAGSADVFVAEYSPGGSHVASRRLGGSGFDGASGIAVASGNILITGSFQDAVELEGAAALGSAGLSDIFLIAYAADAAGKHSLGSLLWSRRYGGGDQDLASGLAVERATPGSPGSLLLTGSYAGATDFGGGPLASAGSTDVFLLRLRP